MTIESCTPEFLMELARIRQFTLFLTVITKLYGSSFDLFFDGALSILSI